MLDQISMSALDQAQAWIGSFRAALGSGDASKLGGLFAEECYWRNLGGISWPIVTFSGSDVIGAELIRRAAEFKVRDFTLDTERLAPRENTIAGHEVIEAAIRFETVHGRGEGVVRLFRRSGQNKELKAWTISTGLDMDHYCESMEAGTAAHGHSRNFSEPTWLEKRQAALSYDDRDPDVLVVGGGHAGVTAAAELKRLGYDVLVVDRLGRVGDNWRLRYDGLRLHNTWHVNHFRYLPFPKTMPGYLPKDKIANWIEFYVDAMDINFWTGTTFESAKYNSESGRWAAKLKHEDKERILHPKHIVMATSVVGTPNIPEIPTIDNFDGPVLHSSKFSNGAAWAGKPVVVIGTGTSAHDISQELHAQGAKVTMVQRNSTLVVNVEPAQLYDTIYVGAGPALEVRDLLNSSIPYPVAKQVHQGITKQVEELDRPLLDRLREVGFKLDSGIDGSGWPLKFRTKGGGYYLNVGCSDLIADKAIGLIQASQIERFSKGGVMMKDGSFVPAEAIVLGTGYKGHDHMVLTHFGKEVAERVGAVWGLDPETHEMRNMWTRTGQPGLWFTGGAFSMSRIYSRNIALQIDAIETGRLQK